MKKDTKIEFPDVLRIFELLLHLESNVAEIWNIASTHEGKKSGVFVFEKYCQLLILCQFCTKNLEKWWFFLFFHVSPPQTRLQHFFHNIQHYIFDNIDIIRQNSTIFSIFWQYLTFFKNSTLFNNIQHHSTVFDIIQRNLTFFHKMSRSRIFID